MRGGAELVNVLVCMNIRAGGLALPHSETDPSIRITFGDRALPSPIGIYIQTMYTDSASRRHQRSRFSRQRHNAGACTSDSDRGNRGVRTRQWRIICGQTATVPPPTMCTEQRRHGGKQPADEPCFNGEGSLTAGACRSTLTLPGPAPSSTGPHAAWHCP